MRFKQYATKSAGITLALGILISSCSKNASRTTGSAYNDEKYGGFENVNFTEQETSPGLVFVEGGSFVMGQTGPDNVNYEWNNQAGRKTVSSFYMDETEVTNFAYCEYLYWTQRVYGADYSQVYINALPDTLCWRDKLGYMENYVGYYLRYPAYRDYPVVGVNWLQANNYCKWRSDRVNENIMIREGLYNPNNAQVNDDNFSTDAYLAGEYESGKREAGVRSYAPGTETRNVKIEDGILQPDFRLPTEAEWEYAAYALIGESFDERIENKKIYPWVGNFVRNDNRTGNYLGDMRDNFSRGRGDMMGVAGALNDNADVTAPVYQYPPNDYGLYSMGGNVSEWTMDVYRPFTATDANEFRPYRGNKYRTPVLDVTGVPVAKLAEAEYDIVEMKNYLDTFSTRYDKNFNDKERAFVAVLRAEVEKAVKKLLVDKLRDEANQDVTANIVEAIRNAEPEVVVAPILLDAVSDFTINIPGQKQTREVIEEENVGRTNYKKAQNIDYLDGDLYSTLKYSTPAEFKENESMYNWNNTSLLDNRTRVYKGASWADRAYYLSPSTRRFLDERRSSSKIGFRCVMDRLGSTVTLDGAKKKKKRK